MRHKFYILVFLFLSSMACNKEDIKIEDENTIRIKGVVFDKATEQPVGGARVGVFIDDYSFGYYWSSSVYGEVNTTTNSDGSYQILIERDDLCCDFPYHYWVAAQHLQYIGSDRKDLNRLRLENIDIIDLYLYHSAQLHLHVKNDTIDNNIDSIVITLDKYGRSPFEIEFPEFIRSYEGRNFDSLISFPNLFANCKYYLVVYLGRDLHPNMAKWKYSFILKPDTTTEMNITF